MSRYLIAGRAARAVKKVSLGGDAFLGWGCDALVGFVAPPKSVRGWKLVKGELRFNLASGTGAVMFIKTVAIAAVNRGDVQYLGVAQGLLDARVYGMGVVFGLDDNNGDIGLAIESAFHAQKGFVMRQASTAGSHH